ncbi:SMI1/KNR4 family protein [Clostridiaceae bacterium]|nr:SMI1/KNR4 family protein [Clostridiaceae bacterium]RKI11879.1 SMI1/KNR4 family protein [bacterium 1XD21-70]
MDQIEQYDQRIARIMSKIEALHDRDFSFSCGKWPPAWNPPMGEEDVAAFEAENGIRLPEDYRRFSYGGTGLRIRSLLTENNDVH